MMSRVITISREFGSGGREIGYRLAQKLGIPFYDKEIITIAAEDSNIAEEVFRANDEIIHIEKKEKSHHFSPYSSLYEIPVSDQTFFAQSKILKQLAGKGPCVIVGRCSDVILEDSFDIFICASMKAKIKRLMALEPDMTESALKSQIKEIDEKRRDYYQFYTGNVWGRPQNYDICLNSDRVGIEQCVEFVANLVYER